jgi:sigma-E factor negative regulatory protein RseA
MKEKISALMDGELEGQAAAHSIEELGGQMASREGEALEAWRCYHLISDAMRDTRLLSAGFTARVVERLAAEPTVLAPMRLAPTPRKWFAVPAAAAASVAAIGLVGWLAFGPQQQGTPLLAPVAQVPSAPQPAAAQGIAIKPAMVPLPTATPDYLLAHQGFSPRVYLHGMAPYARTVSDQANEGRK